MSAVLYPGRRKQTKPRCSSSDLRPEPGKVGPHEQRVPTLLRNNIGYDKPFRKHLAKGKWCRGSHICFASLLVEGPGFKSPFLHLFAGAVGFESFDVLITFLSFYFIHSGSVEYLENGWIDVGCAGLSLPVFVELGDRSTYTDDGACATPFWILLLRSVSYIILQLAAETDSRARALHSLAPGDSNVAIQLRD